MGEPVMNYLIVEFYEGKRTVLDKTDCPHDAMALRRYHIEQWSNPAVGRQCVTIEKV